MSYSIEDLKGKTLKKAEQAEGSIILTTEQDDVYTLTYIPDCCASCDITDVAGDLQDLVGAEIVMAEETSNNDNAPEDCYESFTWTFTKLATSKGYVTITWYGTSNGYYSESPSVLKNSRAWDYND